MYIYHISMSINIAVAQLWADGRLFFFSARGLIAAVFVRYRTWFLPTEHTRSTHARHTHAIYQIYCSKAALLNGRLQSRQSSWVRVNRLHWGGSTHARHPSSIFFSARWLFFYTPTVQRPAHAHAPAHGERNTVPCLLPQIAHHTSHHVARARLWEKQGARASEA